MDSLFQEENKKFPQEAWKIGQGQEAVARLTVETTRLFLLAGASLPEAPKLPGQQSPSPVLDSRTCKIQQTKGQSL